MIAVEKTLRDYIAAWNVGTAAERRQLLRACWSRHGRFDDPVVRLVGRTEMELHVARLRTLQPLAHLALAGPVGCDAGHIHFAWELRQGAGDAPLSGSSFGVLDTSGRILRLVSLFRPPLLDRCEARALAARAIARARDGRLRAGFGG